MSRAALVSFVVVVIVAAGYNHDLEPAPLKIYVGVKGKAADGSEIAADANERDQFLARNGLLYGKIYGLALALAPPQAQAQPAQAQQRLGLLEGRIRIADLPARIQPHIDASIGQLLLGPKSMVPDTTIVSIYYADRRSHPAPARWRQTHRPPRWR